MNNSTIKYSLIGAILSVVILGIGYYSHVLALTLGGYGLIILFLFAAGIMATREIFKNHKAEELTAEERSKIRKLTLLGVFLLIDFEFLLYFYVNQGFMAEFASTYPYMTKVIYAALCIGNGISGAILMKSAVMRYVGPQRYAQLDRTVRLAFLLLWFCIWSCMHF